MLPWFRGLARRVARDGACPTDASNANVNDAIPLHLRLPVGTPIYKEFPGYGWFEGRIEYLTFGNRFYRVQYTDGDAEDLSHQDILPLLQKPPPQQAMMTDAQQQQQQNKKKREATTASSSAEHKKVRRSGRERKSTVIHVAGGHTVKKENNYVLKGLSYEYGGVVAEEKLPRAEKEAKENKKRAPRKPREVSQAQQHYRTQKHAVQARVQAKAVLRQTFFHNHAATLAPFLEPKVLHRIEQPLASSSDDDTLGADATLLQPDGIQADMRDYQLQGLQWMSRMYQQNVGFILGDGTLCVRSLYAPHFSWLDS